MTTHSATETPPTSTLHRAADKPNMVQRVRSRPVITTAVVLFVGLVVLLVASARPQDYTPLSIDNSTPTGTRAVAQILRAQGVDVRQTDTLSGARISHPADTTLVVAGAELLAPYQLDSIVDYPGDLVFLDVSQDVLDRVAPGLSVEWSLSSQPVAARCADEDAEAAVRVPVLEEALGGTPGDGVVACFANGDGQYAYGVTEHDGRRVALIAAWPIATNEHLTEDGNAALSLRAMGRHETLVWYVADIFDPSTLTWTADDGSSGPDGAVPPTEVEANPDFLPPGTGSAVYLLALVVLVAAFWKARRFGRLVTEPLPVVVRASEATRGRARLYRRARASGRATASLRAAAALRMGRRLGVPRSAGKEALIDAVARASGRSRGDVTEILYGPPPHDDSTMMRIVHDVDTLESEVHRP